jgi:UDP-glucose 4-epimerase
MKKILITGSSGYIGSHLLNLLDGNHYTIDCIDLQSPQINKGVYHKKDIRNKHVNIEPHKRYDAVIHLAASVNVGESVHYPAKYYENNVEGTLNMLENFSCNNFIFASTGAAESMQSPYGISKRMAEDCIKSFCTKANIDFTIFRFYNVIGSTAAKPTNPDGLFYNLLQAPSKGSFTIYGNDYDTRDGTAVRDYVHVNEICHAIETAIDKPSGKIENLGHGVGYTVKEMVDLFKHYNNVDFKVDYTPRRDGDVESSVLDYPSDYMKSIYSMKDLLGMKNV